MVVALALAAPASGATDKQKLRKSETVVAWYQGQGHWNLRPSYTYCADLRSPSASGRCWRHRQNLRWHRARVHRLTPKPTVRYLSAWMCIHSHEGRWNDPNAPYWGGLQMDYQFMSTYGPELLRSKGTADHWTPMEQMMVAERAHRTRGFGPWPNTARYCGLR